MANTSSRPLRLLSLLQTRRYWPGRDLAERLEVSVRTLRRDIDRLRELGYPVEASRGVDGGYQLAPGAVLPPLVVDDEEAVALAVGMQAAAQGAVAGMEDAAVRALTKVVQVMPRRLQRRVEAVRTVTVPLSWSRADEPVDPAALVTVARACRDDERLEFDYAAPSRESTHRRVEPHRLVSVGRRWYLVAYDLHRHDWRSFRLDRLSAPTLTGESFVQRELRAEDAAAFVRAGLRATRTDYRVEVVVQAPADDVEHKIGRWAEVTSLGDDRSLVVMSTDSLDWPAFALGILDADFEIRGPDELRDLLRQWGTRFVRAAR